MDDYVFESVVIDENNIEHEITLSGHDFNDINNIKDTIAKQLKRDSAKLDEINIERMDIIYRIHLKKGLKTEPIDIIGDRDNYNNIPPS